MTCIRKIAFNHIRKPLKITFATALGRKDFIDSILVRVLLDNGYVGEGEIPTSFAFKRESIRVITEVLRKTIPAFIGVPIKEYGDLMGAIRSRNPLFPMTLSGLEVALFRAWLVSRGVTEFDFWGNKEHSFKTDITIPIVNDDEQLNAWIKKFIGLGFREFKLKISGHKDSDLCRIKKVQESAAAYSENIKIRLDANQGYCKKSFLSFMDACVKRKYPIELIEQPLKKGEYQELREIGKQCSIPIILDEDVQSLSDLYRVLEENCCGGCNIKISKSGLAESALMIEEARKHGLKLMIGCMTETMTGLSAAVYLAAGTGAFSYIDLDSIHFLFHKKSYRNIVIAGPEFHVL